MAGVAELFPVAGVERLGGAGGVVGWAGMTIWLEEPFGAGGPLTDGSAVTIGVFDGVHRGHRAVLAGVSERARRMGGLTEVALTFDVHPLSVVAPERAPRLLTALSRRIELLAELGMETVGVLPFAKVRDLPPDRFVREILVEGFAARLVTVGTDFRYGRDRTGDVNALRRMGERFGFAVETVRLLEEEGGAISSSTIRARIAAGEVEAAAELLGREHEAPGKVAAGDGRGSSIGFPTANLIVDPSLAVPGRGVYAVRAALAGAPALPAVCNIGVRPTFTAAGAPEVLEFHILDWNGDLYGREATVRFVSRLRPERAFPDPPALIAQIKEDIAQARPLLGLASS